MTPQEFIAKWQNSTLSERSACQQHFLDICELLGQPKPAAADPDGAWYTFERGVKKTTGGAGWADVWMRNRFGWEYKGKHKDLAAAYQQLLLYREDLENPPLLIVCDMDRFQIHTNFTGTVKAVHEFDLTGLAQPRNLELLRRVFTDPDSLKPGQTTESITRQAAELIGQITDGLRQRKVPPDQAAHFVMKLMFCMFAEDIGLLPEQVFTRTLKAATGGKQGKAIDDAAGPRLSNLLRSLFAAMATGGLFGTDEIRWFNGGLFDETDDVVDLSALEIQHLTTVNHLDWSDVEPSIFGTLFERTLDPAKRSQIGAHYTSRTDIETLLEPVVMQPLRREWQAVIEQCEKLGDEIAKGKTTAAKTKKVKQRDRLLIDFNQRLTEVTVLDPACGSGNFLYVALHLLLDLEKEVITFAARRGVGMLPQVRPTQLAGIEINPYAQQLASVVIWIGYLQWMHHNGFNPPSHPVLEPIETIQQRDAILDLSDPEHPKEPEWPAADFIVGNPPFLGGSRLLEELGKDYQQALWSIYSKKIPGASDLCCYWFEKARTQLIAKQVTRAGLLATQAIRGGANRKVLERIKETGEIFFAESDRDWVLDGALVHVSMVGFDNGSESVRMLDGRTAEVIYSNLTCSVDVTTARKLVQNENICFIGPKKAGKFEIPEEVALDWLGTPNPHGRPNSDVLVPWINGTTLVNGRCSHWIIDTGSEMSIETFSRYEGPFQHVLERVKPDRDSNKEARTKENWWRFKRTADDMRIAIRDLDWFPATVRHSKHRIFAHVDASVICDDGIYLFATSSHYFFGILQSSLHELWTRSQGTQVRERESGFRYTPTTCFETFPFPEPTDDQREAIAAAALELDTLRNNWLNPPEWTRTEVLEFPGSADGPWRRYVDPASVDSRGIGQVKYPRLVPRDAETAAALKKRTLTNLYNQRPTWLDLAHRRLDHAVLAAYGWPATITDDDLLAALLALNLQK